MNNWEFKAISKRTGQFVYGLPMYKHGDYIDYIHGWTESGDDGVGEYFEEEILPNTLGLVSEFKDKGGNKICQNDKVFVIRPVDGQFNGVVIFEYGAFYIKSDSSGRYHSLDENYTGCEVVGNIYSKENK